MKSRHPQTEPGLGLNSIDLVPVDPKQLRGLGHISRRPVERALNEQCLGLSEI